MSAAAEIVIVGSHCPGIFLRVKRPPLPGETVIGWDYQEPVDGGKGSNQSIAAARLGGRVSFVGCVGRDAVGDSGERWMKLAGVDTTYLYKSETTGSGVGFILLDEAGVPAMVSSLGANAELTAAQVDAALDGLPVAKFLLTQLEIPAEVALHALRAAKARGLTTIFNPAPAPDAPAVQDTAWGRLDFVDILVPNESEARLLLGLPPADQTPLPEIAARLREELGVGAALITAGEQGFFGCDALGEWSEAPPPVQVVDTSGAGDMFCAALAVALAEGLPICRASRRANALAALSVTHAGTIPSYPTLAEAEAFLAT